MKAAKDLWRGIRRHPWKVCGYTFTAFSVLFTIVKALTHFVPGISITGLPALTFVGLFSFGYALKCVWKPSRIRIKVANSNTVIEVLFGDIFALDGLRVIAVNDFFDSTLGKPVSDKSLHGLFLTKCFGGHAEAFDKQVNQQLQGVRFEVTERSEGKTRRFDIGTTAVIKANEDSYLIFALSCTDPATSKASSDVTKMWIALHSVWKRARVESSGHPLNLPLVGGGLSGLGLPVRDLLNIIILSAITETKAKQVTGTIRIVLWRDVSEELDLREVQLHWGK